MMKSLISKRSYLKNDAFNLNVLSSLQASPTVSAYVPSHELSSREILSNFRFKFTALLFSIVMVQLLRRQTLFNLLSSHFQYFQCLFVSATSCSSVEQFPYSCLGNSILFSINTDLFLVRSLQVVLLLTLSSGSLKVLNVFKNGKQKFY